jgi:hypothetical protein
MSRTLRIFVRSVQEEIEDEPRKEFAIPPTDLNRQRIVSQMCEIVRRTIGSGRTESADDRQMTIAIEAHTPS